MLEATHQEGAYPVKTRVMGSRLSSVVIGMLEIAASWAARADGACGKPIITGVPIIASSIATQLNCMMEGEAVGAPTLQVSVRAKLRAYSLTQRASQ